MRYNGKIEYAQERKIRERNTRLYRVLHLPIWIWVFFLAPGPLVFSMFAHGFSWGNATWLGIVLVGTAIAGLKGQLPGVEPCPYILRFDEDKPNPLYRKICYTFAWNAVISFALLNLTGLAIASLTGEWRMKEIYTYAYSPLCAFILFLGLMGKLPRVGPSTRGEGTERRYFYGSVWAVSISQTVLLIVWKLLPSAVGPTQVGSQIKFLVFASSLLIMGLIAWRGRLPRTRPIVPGEIMVSD
jgi:hypothetical protein